MTVLTKLKLTIITIYFVVAQRLLDAHKAFWTKENSENSWTLQKTTCCCPSRQPGSLPRHAHVWRINGEGLCLYTFYLYEKLSLTAPYIWRTKKEAQDARDKARANLWGEGEAGRPKTKRLRRDTQTLAKRPHRGRKRAAAPWLSRLPTRRTRTWLASVCTHGKNPSGNICSPGCQRLVLPLTEERRHPGSGFSDTTGE